MSLYDKEKTPDPEGADAASVVRRLCHAVRIAE